MRILRKIATFLGFGKDENHDGNDNKDDQFSNDGLTNGGPTKGFSVRVPVTVEKVYQGPVISQCKFGDGGVQGLKWYAKRLRIDEDGDIADEFLDEVVLPESSSGTGHGKPQSKFQVKYSTRPAIVRGQVIANNGNLQQRVEYKGRLQLV